MLASQPDGLMRRPLPPGYFKLDAENLSDIPGSSWWVVYGNAEPDVEVSATLSDGGPIDVYRLGNVWACEWTGNPRTTASIRRSDRDDVMDVAPWKLELHF